MSGPRLLGGLSRVRSKPVLTGRAEFEQLLRRKSAWLQDVKKHPLVLGVPLGRNGGPDKAISVDLGMKNMAQISTRELANSSSEFKQALLDRAKGGPLEGQPEDLRRAEPIPMSVIVKEDVMRLPIAAPVRALSPHSSTRALASSAIVLLTSRVALADAQGQPCSASERRGSAGLARPLLQRRPRVR